MEYFDFTSHGSSILINTIIHYTYNSIIHFFNIMISDSYNNI